MSETSKTIDSHTENISEVKSKSNRKNAQRRIKTSKKNMAFKAPEGSQLHYTGPVGADIFEDLDDPVITPIVVAAQEAKKPTLNYRKQISEMMKKAFTSEGLRYKEEWLSMITHRSETREILPSQEEINMFALGVSQEKVTSSQEKVSELINVLKDEVSKLQVVSKDMKDLKKVGTDALTAVTKTVHEHLTKPAKVTVQQAEPPREKPTHLTWPKEKFSPLLKLLGFDKTIYSVDKNIDRIRPYVTAEEAEELASCQIGDAALSSFRGILVRRIREKQIIYQ